MARAKTNRLYRNFTRGMITEAGPLTYPENASIAEDNCQIFRQGNRSRRLGLGYEPGAEMSSYRIPSNEADIQATRTYRWEAVNGDANLSFLVHRMGTSIFFYDVSAPALSNGLKPFSIDLTPFLVPNTVGTGKDAEVSMVGGRGYLFVVGAQIEPFLVEYKPATDTITTQRIYIQIRDFKGLNDGLANDQEPTTLSNEHKYNLMNQGWVDPTNTGAGGDVQYFNSFGGIGTYAGNTTQVISDYFTQFNRYPGNNKQWWVARDSTTGNFDAELLSKFFTGANRAARGHFIVNAFYIDRTAVSGVPGLPVESILDRPNTVSFFGGRVWYAVNSTVYFSQVLDDKAKAGFCYQEADPTSEDISDLVATDGGVIPIPEMAKAVRLVPAAGGLLVFGTNGIWFVSGTSSGFTANDFAVSKINPIGTESPDSIVEAEGQIFWWSRVGIMGLTASPGRSGTDSGFDRQNVSEQTIQSFYNHQIPEDSKLYAKGIFDPATNTVQWLFRSGDTPSRYMYDRILNMDLTLGAFFPWTISTPGPYISDVFTTPKLNPLPQTNAIRSNFIKYLCAVPDDTGYHYTFGYFNNNNFADWQSFNGVGSGYMSFIESGYELLDDAMRDKQAPYVWCYLRRTEENLIPNGSGDYDLDKPSSCYFQIKWDWSSSSRSNKWSSKVQVYRFTRVPEFDESDLSFDTGYPLVVTKNKVRGTGKSIQFRFESDEIGKDFDLLGWAVPVSGNTDT